MFALIDYSRPTGHPRAAIFKYAIAVMLGVYLPVLIHFSLRPSGPGGDPITDKVLHFVVYGGLTALWAGALPRAKLLTIFIGVSLVGVSLEIAQGLSSPSRTASILDQLANMTGALFALFIWVVLAVVRDRFRRRLKPIL